MRSLQLTDEYTFHGLTEEEYTLACTYIDKKAMLKDKLLIQANNDIFKARFKFSLDTVVGDTTLERGCFSIPTKVGDEVVEHVVHGDKKSYKCFANKDWKDNHTGVIIHEDAHSAINCALDILQRPFAVIITKVPINK